MNHFERRLPHACLDLLALLADQNKNASVLLDTKPTPSRFDDFKLTTVNDQPQLVFQPNPERKAALRVWELQLLLNQPDLQQRFVYLADVDEPRALFGFVKRQIGLLLN